MEPLGALEIPAVTELIQLPKAEPLVAALAGGTEEEEGTDSLTQETKCGLPIPEAAAVAAVETVAVVGL
jgi:hypothetical protein